MLNYARKANAHNDTPNMTRYGIDNWREPLKAKDLNLLTKGTFYISGFTLFRVLRVAGVHCVNYRVVSIYLKSLDIKSLVNLKRFSLKLSRCDIISWDIVMLTYNICLSS